MDYMDSSHGVGRVFKKGVALSLVASLTLLLLVWLRRALLLDGL